MHLPSFTVRHLLRGSSRFITREFERYSVAITSSRYPHVLPSCRRPLSPLASNHRHKESLLIIGFRTFQHIRCGSFPGLGRSASRWGRRRIGWSPRAFLAAGIEATEPNRDDRSVDRDFPEFRELPSRHSKMRPFAAPVVTGGEGYGGPTASGSSNHSRASTGSNLQPNARRMPGCPKQRSVASVLV